MGGKKGEKSELDQGSVGDPQGWGLPGGSVCNSCALTLFSVKRVF